MLYLAERGRGYVMQILIFSAIGALVILFAFYGFHLAAFSYVFTGGAARFWFSLDSAARLRRQRAQLSHPRRRRRALRCCTSPSAAAATSATPRRCSSSSRSPPLVTTQTVSAPWLWALPFLFTFLGGVFADALETRYRKLFLVLHRRQSSPPGNGVPHRPPAARALSFTARQLRQRGLLLFHGFIWYSSGGTPPAR